MKEKSQSYDVLKVFTTVLVVFGHASRMYTGEGVVSPAISSEMLKQCTYIIYSFHMPLYMCVTGMVYGFCIDDLEKYQNTVTFIKAKAKRLLLPYFFWGIFYVAPVMTAFQFTDYSYMKYIMVGLIFGLNSRHLWYISTLFLIFLICGVYRALSVKYKFRICEGMLLILSFAGYLLSRFVPGVFGFNSVAAYFIWFYIGILMNRHGSKVQKLTINPFMTILFLLSFVLFYTNGINVLAAFSAILLFYGLSFKVSEKIVDKNWFVQQKRYGFGLYVFHPIIIYMLFYFLGGIICNPILLCVAIFLISYIVSYVISIAIMKSPISFLLGGSI